MCKFELLLVMYVYCSVSPDHCSESEVFIQTCRLSVSSWEFLTYGTLNQFFVDPGLSLDMFWAFRFFLKFKVGKTWFTF